MTKDQVTKCEELAFKVQKSKVQKKADFKFVSSTEEKVTNNRRWREALQYTRTKEEKEKYEGEKNNWIGS